MIFTSLCTEAGIFLSNNLTLTTMLTNLITMQTPVKIVLPLTTESVEELQRLIKHSCNLRVRTRVQAIWWSSLKSTMDQISQLCDVGRDTVST